MPQNPRSKKPLKPRNQKQKDTKGSKAYIIYKDRKAKKPARKVKETSQTKKRRFKSQIRPPPLTSKYLTFTRYSQEKKSKTLTPRCSSPTASEPRNFGEASTRSSGENLLNVENTGPSSKSRKLIHPWSGS